MGLQIAGVDVESINFDGAKVEELQFDGTTVWTSAPLLIHSNIIIGTVANSRPSRSKYYGYNINANYGSIGNLGININLSTNPDHITTVEQLNEEYGPGTFSSNIIDNLQLVNLTNNDTESYPTSTLGAVSRGAAFTISNSDDLAAIPSWADVFFVYDYTTPSNGITNTCTSEISDTDNSGAVTNIDQAKNYILGTNNPPIAYIPADVGESFEFIISNARLLSTAQVIIEFYNSIIPDVLAYGTTMFDQYGTVGADTNNDLGYGSNTRVSSAVLLPDANRSSTNTYAYWNKYYSYYYTYGSTGYYQYVYAYSPSYFEPLPVISANEYEFDMTSTSILELAIDTDSKDNLFLAVKVDLGDVTCDKKLSDGTIVSGLFSMTFGASNEYVVAETTRQGKKETFHRSVSDTNDYAADVGKTIFDTNDFPNDVNLPNVYSFSMGMSKKVEERYVAASLADDLSNILETNSSGSRFINCKALLRLRRTTSYA